MRPLAVTWGPRTLAHAVAGVAVCLAMGVAAVTLTSLSLVMGFAGVRSRPDGLHFKPQLPAQLPRLSFRLSYRGRVLQFSADSQQASYQLLSGEPLTLFHSGQAVTLTLGQTVSKAIGVSA